MHDDTPNMFCSIVDDIGQRDGLPSESEGDLDRLLSVIVLFDYPFDFPALDEALFSLAVQDWDRIEVVLALPDCGFGVHREVEAAILAQSWPPMSSRKIVSVSTLSERTLSANLINAGLSYATGQYIAFLHHQDLIYQHAYPSLIGRLEDSDAVAAFGGIRLARHARGSRHWQVQTKQAIPTDVSRLIHLIDGTAAIHCFVADRHRLSADYLHVHNPTLSLATNVFFLRLSLHPKSDFSIATTPVCESRHFPQPSPQGAASGDGRLPSLDRMLLSLESGDLILRDTVVSPNILLAEAIKALSPR